MKRYVTFVKNEEESRDVQEALMSAGFEQTGGGKKLKGLDMPFLFIDPKINRVNDFTTVCQYILSGEYTVVNAYRIIADPFQLDGAKKPEQMIEIDGKEFSVSTIKAALRDYVD